MKKSLSILLSLLFLLTMLPMGTVTAETAPTVVVSDAVGAPGGTVSVAVRLENNPGLVSARIKVGYNADVLELVDKEIGDFPANGYSWGRMDINPFVINFCDALSLDNYTGELLATLTFKIKEDAAGGDYPLSLIFSCEDDFYGADWTTVWFEANEGAVTVQNNQPDVPNVPDVPDVPDVPGVPDVPDPIGQPTVTLPDVAGAPGEILSVPVLLKNNPGLVSARIKVGYNADVLELVSKEIGDFPANGYSWGLLHINPFVINFCDAVSYEDYTCELLATLTFKIKEDAAVGDYPLTLTFNCEDDFYNAVIMDIVQFAADEGSVAIHEHVYDHACDADCNLCGAIRQVEPHPYALQSTVDATCTADGVYTYSCGVCGHTYDEVIPATGHTAVIVAGYAPTCTTDGLTDGEKCSVCGEILVAQEVIPATGHTAVIVAGYAATCTTDGLTDGEKCSVCGEILMAQEVIPATGHTAVVVEGYAATCTTDGLTDGEKCNLCDEIFVAQEVIPATGHAYADEITTQPTCGAEGVLTHICAVCGHIDTEAIPATGAHTYDHMYDADCNLCGGIREVPAMPEKGNGDADGNGRVNNRDVGYIQQYLNDWANVKLILHLCDVDGNGRVNNRDLGYIQQYLNDWDIVLG